MGECQATSAVDDPSDDLGPAFVERNADGGYTVATRVGGSQLVASGRTLAEAREGLSGPALVCRTLQAFVEAEAVRRSV
jgi:hypothetical protein